MKHYGSPSANDGPTLDRVEHPFNPRSFPASSARAQRFSDSILSKPRTRGFRSVTVQQRLPTTSSECSTGLDRNLRKAKSFFVPRKLRPEFSSSTTAASTTTLDSQHIPYLDINPELAYPTPPPSPSPPPSPPLNPELAYPSPPPSPPLSPSLPPSSVILDERDLVSESHRPSPSSKDIYGTPFPLDPAELSDNQKLNHCNESLHWSPQHRHASPGSRFPTPSPDRFIPVRRGSQDLSKTYRLSKSPERLTAQERRIRHHSASPNPFGSLQSRRTRNQRQGLAVNGSPALLNRARSRAIGTTNVTTLSQEPLSSQNRQISAGAVWNVGGGINPQHSFSGPVRAITNGRGGFFSSGSNAPVFASQFLNDLPPEQNMERMESRLYAALDIDQASRMLNFGPSLVQPRSVTTGSIGLKRKAPYVESRMVWKDEAWTEEGSSQLLDAPGLRDDYYCTTLAYCHTTCTLAVGLTNRVYLWSEDFGVRYPPDDSEQRSSTYVTSLSFSSPEGGHSILAIGRNTGQICLWSLYDPEDIRFKAHQPNAVACIAFKPVTTRRSSERFCSMVATEELLVGDEVGNIYYYSIEWMSRDQIDIHGWNGHMKLLARISVHSQQICGLAWSPTGEFFATGANDNACCLFEVKEVLKEPTPPVDDRPLYKRPLHTLVAGFGLPNLVPRAFQPDIRQSLSQVSLSTNNPFPLTPATTLQRSRVTPGQHGSLVISQGRQKHRWLHSAAIKAIAFCPWQRGLIATGGGSNDRAIHFYHTFSGACLATINVHAQVTSLIWSTTRREIAATFGYAQPEHPYRIAVFSWPECRQVVAIPFGSDMRALMAIAYPGGPGETSAHTSLGETWYSRTAEEGCIVVACSDESVKFHEIWSGSRKSTGLSSGLLGGSSILEALEGVDCVGDGVIR